jgi:hypothetical protein
VSPAGLAGRGGGSAANIAPIVGPAGHLGCRYWRPPAMR